MADQVGLRERKRQRTRQALVSAAMRLFEEKGYEETTVAEIAAAAEVSTKTFFNYFTAKDEVLFPHLSGRIQGAVRLIEEHAPGDGMVDVLLRATEHMLAAAVDDELGSGLASTRLRLIMWVPDVQAATLRRYFVAETQLAQALYRAFPDTLDWPTAAAATGSLVGAVLAAALVSMQRGDSADQVQAAVRRAMNVAEWGLRAADRAAPSSRC